MDEALYNSDLYSAKTGKTNKSRTRHSCKKASAVICHACINNLLHGQSSFASRTIQLCFMDNPAWAMKRCGGGGGLFLQRKDLGGWSDESFHACTVWILAEISLQFLYSSMTLIRELSINKQSHILWSYDNKSKFLYTETVKLYCIVLYCKPNS